MTIRTTSTVAIIAALGLGFAGPAMAEDSEGNASEQSQIDASTEAHDLSSIQPSMLENKSLKDRTGEDIGDISDIVMDKSGKQRYAVVSVGDFLGIGGKSVAVPFDQLELEGDNLILMSQDAEQSLKARPEYKAEDYQSVEEHGGGSGSGDAQ